MLPNCFPFSNCPGPAVHVSCYFPRSFFNSFRCPIPPVPQHIVPLIILSSSCPPIRLVLHFVLSQNSSRDSSLLPKPSVFHFLFPPVPPVPQPLQSPNSSFPQFLLSPNPCSLPIPLDSQFLQSPNSSCLPIPAVSQFLSANFCPLTPVSQFLFPPIPLPIHYSFLTLYFLKSPYSPHLTTLVTISSASSCSLFPRTYYFPNTFLSRRMSFLL